MSDPDNIDYLLDGFDPRSLTVPRLRSILVTYDINYPSTAKKPQLIDLFNEHVVPRAPAILEVRRRAKRSSMGIVDMPSQESTETNTDYDEPAARPSNARRTRSRSPRKTTGGRSTRPSTVEPEEYQGPAPVLAAPSLPRVRESPRKRATRSVSVAETTDTDATDHGDGRRRRQRRTATPAAATMDQAVEDEATPVARRMDEATPIRRTVSTQRAGESPFSSDNPFQSGGSSPPAAAKTPMAGRRKTTGVDPARIGVDPARIASTTSAASRRRTDGPAFALHDPSAMAHVPTRAPERKERRLTKRSEPEPETKSFFSQMHDPEPGEEFTPDEQLALEREEHAHADLQVARRKPHASRKRNWSTPIWVLVATLLSAYAAWYRQEKIAVGYCGLGRDYKQLIPSHITIPEWADEYTSKLGVTVTEIPVPALPDWARSLIEPDCEPCPAHAYCNDEFVVTCEPDFVLKPHPLSLNGLLPLVPTCEPDGQKVRRVQAVADRVVEELRERRAKFECGALADDGGQPAPDAAIEEQELKAAVKEKRNKRMAEDEFDDLWVAAIGEVKSRDEVEVEEENDEGGAVVFPHTRLSSTSLARLPYTCAARRSVTHGLARHRLTLAGTLLAVWTAWYARRALRTHRALAAQVPGLVDEVLERLATQKELAFDSDDDEDAFLFLPNLRDDVLRSMHRLADRDRLWQRVRAVVEQNSNVRTGQREGHNGEVGRAWEWIGPSRLGPPPPSLAAGGVRAADGVSRRRSGRGRASWGAAGGMGAETDAAVVPAEERRRKQQRPDAAPDVSGARASSRRWEESRPIY